MNRNRFLALLTALCLLLSALPIHTQATGIDPVKTLYHNRHHWEATHQVRTDSRGQRIVSQKNQAVLPAGENEFLISDTFGADCQWAIANDGFLYIWCSGEMPVREAGQYPWSAYTDLYHSAYIDAGSVADNAFANHDNLQVVILESSVTAIGQYAFAYCDSMEEVWFYGAAPSIANNAFTDTITYLVYHIADASFEPLMDQDFGGELYWGVWVNTIASGMFGTVEWMLNEDMALHLQGAFGPMQDLSNAGDYPWSSWSQQITYVSCSWITHLGSYALADFTALIAVDFDETLTSLGDGAFRNCDDFTLYFSGNAPTLGAEVFTTDNFILEYPYDNATWTREVVNRFYGRSNNENELPRDDETDSAEVTCGTPSSQIYNAMIALKDQYPEGMHWTNDDYYAWNGGYFTGGYGCAGFAFILSDAAFGYLPSRKIHDDITIGDIRVGDILRINNDTHSVIVLEVYESHVVIAEGNYNSSIHWGRTLNAQTIASTTDYIMTRYPEHNWTAGSCLDPRTCLHCGTQAEAPGHSWIVASCTAPQTCAICGFTEGSPAGHVFDNEQDNTCNVCGFQRDIGDDPSTEIQFYPSAAELEVLRLTNLIRLEHGLKPLTATAALQQATDIRANEIETLFKHTRPDGTSCFTVLHDLNIPYWSAAENIAYGYQSASEVMDGWMNSEGHRVNILTADMGHMGIGEQDYFWVQLFTDAPAYTSIRVDVPADMVVQPGTSIDDMGLVAVLRNTNGDCWLPLSAAYCSGYDPNAGGTQTISVTVLGVSCTFTLTAGGHTHTWVEATCEAPKTCSTCGKAEGAPLGHNWLDATCETPKVCSVCGKTDGTALNHTWVDATCETPKTCSVCGKTDGTALNHSWVDATCETPKTCSVCGKTDGTALNHTWVDATCETPKFCSVCGKPEGMALGHDWTGVSCEEPNTCNRCGISSGGAVGHIWQDATCQAPMTCAVCGITSGKPNAHDWKSATCIMPQTCQTCGLTEGDPLPHTWVNATCLISKTCSVCGATDGEPLGHTWQPADCLTPSTCANCRQTQGDPLGHDWTDATCQLPKTCVRCSITDGLSLPHSFQDGYCTVCHAPERVLGDASGDSQVTYDDALRVLRASIELEYLTPEASQACDVDGNGRLDYNDALLILRFSIGLITEFPRKS